MTIMTTDVRPIGKPRDFDEGFLDGEIAAETGMTIDHAQALMEMADDYSGMYAQGFYEGFWSRYAVLSLWLHDLADAEVAEDQARLDRQMAVNA